MKKLLNNSIWLNWSAVLAMASVFGSYAINNIGFVLFLLFVIGHIISKKLKPEFNKDFIPFLVLLLYTLLSYFWSISPDKTAKNLSLIFMPFILAGLMSFFGRKLKLDLPFVFNKYAWATSFVFILYFIRALFRYFQQKDSSVFFYHNFTSLFHDNAVYISFFVSVAFIYTLTKLHKNKYDYILMLLNFIFLLMCSSKNLIITNLAVVLVYYVSVLLSGKKNKAFQYFFLGTVSIILILSPFIWERFSNIAHQVNFDFNRDNYFNENWNGLSLRLFQLKVFLDIMHIPQYFWWGTGLNAAQGVIDRFYDYYQINSWYRGYNLHNQYAQTTIELGVFGFIFLFSSLLSILKKAVQTKYLFFYFLFIVLLVSFFTEAYLNRQKGLYFITIIFTFVMIWRRNLVAK